MMAGSVCFVPTCWVGNQAVSTRSAISLVEASHVHADPWHTEPRSRRQTCIGEIDFDADAQPGDHPQKGQ